MEAIDKGRGSPDEKRLAKERLANQLLILGGITLLGVKGDIASFQRGRNLYFDPDFAAEGIARQMLKEQELLSELARLGNTDGLTKLLKRQDLPRDLLDRLNVEISDALTKGRLPDESMKRVLARLTLPPTWQPSMKH